jgi:hypothetical protein
MPAPTKNAIDHPIPPAKSFREFSIPSSVREAAATMSANAIAYEERSTKRARLSCFRTFIGATQARP